MISVIIPSSGEINAVRRLCHSLRGQNIHEPYEVLIVANPPNQRLHQAIAELPENFQYFSSEKRGANTARNVGIKNARGRFLFFFDSDCELPAESFLQRTCDYLDEKTEMFAIGGPYRPSQTLDSEFARAYYYIQSKWLFEGRDIEGGQKYLIGGNMHFRREAFEKFGMFDEKLRFGGTETEFFRRIPTGNIAFFPEHFVLHDYRIQIFSFLKKAFLQGIGRSYIGELHGENEPAQIKYGEQITLGFLGMSHLPRYGVNWYSRAFEAGERFYSKSRITQPSVPMVVVEILKFVFMKKKTTPSIVEHWIRITANFRTKYDSK